MVNRGGLLASTGATALGFARFVSFGRAPEGDGAGDGAGGGAGDGGAAAAAAAGGGEDEDFFGGSSSSSAADQGDGAGDAAKPGEGAGDQGAKEVAEWMKSFSGEKKDGELSHQEWLAKIGVKDLDSLAQIARDNQKALRESGRVKVPGEGASEAEVKAYREAVGAPEEPGGYEVTLPEIAGEKFELDAGFLDPMKAIAHKHNIPAAAFKEMGEAFMAAQYQSVIDEAATHNQQRDATLKEWGPQAEQGKEEFRRGLDVLGLKTADVKRIQNGLGAKDTLELFRKVGQMAGEDFFSGNTGRPAERFGVSSAEGAQAAIDGMLADPATREKIRAKDPVTVQRYNRLTDALAHFKQRAASAR